MTTQQPEALRLADQLDLYATGDAHQKGIEQAADELRRLHELAVAQQALPDERNFCPRCGKRTKDIHTCTPPQEMNK